MQRLSHLATTRGRAAATIWEKATSMHSADSRRYGFGSHVSDNDPEILERAKERHLKGQTRSRTFEEAPGWEEALASDSEAIVKAERTSPKPFKQLQEETVEVIMEEDEAVEGGEDKGATGGAL